MLNAFDKITNRIARPTEEKPKLWVMYGSQKGSSEVIARRLQTQGTLTGFDVELCTLNEYAATQIFEPQTTEQRTNLIIVSSTTGDGDAPDNATAFWKFIRNKKLPAKMLTHIDYITLALGDSNYNKFCHVGKIIDHKLFLLGAVRKQPVTLVDAVEDMAAIVEPFIKNVWQLFRQSDNPNFKDFLLSFFATAKPG